MDNKNHRMKFILIFGPGAVGKMTVGQGLAKITDLKLFHNHMAVEFVSPFFNYGSPEGRRLVGLFRRKIFEAVANSDMHGLIFTYMWAFESQSDWDYVDDVCRIFESKSADIYFVELEADFEERRRRNSTSNRLEHKPTKRNLALSERRLIAEENDHRLNSLPGEIKRENYIRINTADVEPHEAAMLIKDTFAL